MPRFRFTIVILTVFVSGVVWAQTDEQMQAAEEKFMADARAIQMPRVEGLPVQNKGRLKPLDSLARETNLFLTGKRSQYGLSPTHFFLSLAVVKNAEEIPLIEVRDPELRLRLGLSRNRRHFSIQELGMSGLESLATPILEKEAANARAVTPFEKKISETFHQYWFGKNVVSGEAFLSAVDFNGVGHGGHEERAGHRTIVKTATEFLGSLGAGVVSKELVDRLLHESTLQPVPELMSRYLGKMGLEVFYNKAHIFRWTAGLYFILALLLFSERLRSRLGQRGLHWIFGLSLLLHASGFGLRVWITGFAPVTNMYGTMLWVAFGIMTFSWILLVLYKNYFQVGLLTLGSALTLLLTEGFPLVLSPDMDPIVAVLRSNFWLTTHVLTITISYAAFTIAMLMGNYVLIRTLFSEQSRTFYRNYAHSVYRMIQLGVLLLSAGIILGGVWADYSWGRFWGWDPKETWALIADVGFLAILHARHMGMLGEFGLLAASPAAYLLVVMAWYGVNFILASGLHSYGFSSGGAAAVMTFVGLQLGLLFTVLAVRYYRSSSRKMV